MELEMLRFTKLASIAAATVFAVSLFPLATVPARAAAASPTDTPAPSASKLHRGDLVRLRSGGPLMTIHQIDGDQVDCFWTDFNGEPNDAKFPVYVLQKL
jgi:uncharacterized protein YodC (DUF2158 family)